MEKACTVHGGAVTAKGMEMGSRKGAGNLEMAVACVLQGATEHDRYMSLRYKHFMGDED